MKGGARRPAATGGAATATLPAPAADRPRASLGAEAVRGTLWSYLSFASGKGMMFVSTVILARLLTPTQFGLIGFCLIAINYLDVINTLGMDAALVARRDRIVEAANAAFIISILIGVLLFGLAWVIAPTVARFFHEQQVTVLLRVLASVLVLGAFGMVPGSMLQRQLRFKTKMIPDLSRNVVRGGVSIVMALAGFGVWSLVWGQVAGSVVSIVLLWILVDWRPTRQFDRQVNREMLGYGGHVVAVDVVGAVSNNVDYLLIGRILGSAALGFYTLAYRIPELIIRNLHLVVSKVTFPVLSQIQTDSARLRSIYFSYLRYMALCTFPAGVGFALTAPAFVTTFYTDKWAPAIPVAQFIALAMAISSISYVPGVLYKAINRPEILNVTSIVKVVFTVAVLAASVRWGIAGVAAGQLVVACFAVTLDCIVVSRVVNFPLDQTLASLTPALVGSIVMGVAVLSARTLVAPSGVVTLAFLSAVGALVYVATVVVFSRETVTRAGALLRATFARSAKRPA